MKPLQPTTTGFRSTTIQELFFSELDSVKSALIGICDKLELLYDKFFIDQCDNEEELMRIIFNGYISDSEFGDYQLLRGEIEKMFAVDGEFAIDIHFMVVQ